MRSNGGIAIYVASFVANMDFGPSTNVACGEFSGFYEKWVWMFKRTLHKCERLVLIQRKAYLWRKCFQHNCSSHSMSDEVLLDVESRLHLQVNMVLVMRGTHQIL